VLQAFKQPLTQQWGNSNRVEPLPGHLALKMLYEYMLRLPAKRQLTIWQKKLLESFMTWLEVLGSDHDKQVINFVFGNNR
jgi:hypothetical protein